MLKKIIITILLIILVFIVHQSFMQKLDARFILWPAILVFVLFVFDNKIALFWSVGAGFLLDTFSTLPFGTHLIILFIITWLMYLLAKNFITNRSIVSLLVLTFIATILYLSLLFIWQSITQTLVFSLSIISVPLISNLILAIILFLITLRFTRKLQTNLIIGE